MSDINIKEALAFEIKPGHKYLLIFDKRSLTMNEASILQNTLKEEMQCDAIAVGLGNSVQDMKLVDLTEEEPEK